MQTFSWPSYFDHFFGAKYYPLHQNPSKEWCVFTVYNSSIFPLIQYNEIFSRSPKRSIIAKFNCQFSYFILFNFHNIWIIIIPGYHFFTWPDHMFLIFFLSHSFFFLLSLLCWFLLFSLTWSTLILECLRDQWYFCHFSSLYAFSWWSYNHTLMTSIFFFISSPDLSFEFQTCIFTTQYFYCNFS